MLLTHEHCVGKTSFEDMLKVHGQTLPTYQAVCAALGLLASDDEWHIVMDEAGHTSMPDQIRELFVSVLVFCSPSDPLELFCTHVHIMWDDFKRDHPTVLARDLHDLVLLDVEKRLQVEGREDIMACLPTLSDARRAQLLGFAAASEFEGLPRMVREQLEHDTDFLQREVHRRLVGDGPDHEGRYRPAQLKFHQDVMRAVDDPTETVRLFNLDARAGTGKTYLENGLLCDARLRNGGVALGTAISGIAATLMFKASTFHSRYKAPLIGLDGCEFQSLMASLPLIRCR
jgi:hypothetical protein